MKNIKLVVAVFLLLNLSGCKKISNWQKTMFLQATKMNDVSTLSKKYLKTISIYDVFDTVAIFDVLWLSDEIRTSCANMSLKAQGKDEDVIQAYSKQQLAINDHFVSFYVLSPLSIALNEKPYVWTAYLLIDGKSHPSFDIKSVDLAPEFSNIFKKVISNHKRAYEVKFDRKINGKDILQSAKNFEFHLSNVTYDVTINWPLN